MQTDHAALGGRYEILEELGPKGVSIVYRGYDRVAGREVVIKRVAPDLGYWSRYTEKDLVEDAIALASLKDPNFLTVYDFGKDEHGLFVITEPLQGVILEGALQKNELSVEQFIWFVKQTLDSLIAAHEAGLTGIHLDPWNIMLLRQAGGRYGVKILGLGRVAINALPILETDDSAHESKPQSNQWAEYLSLGRLYYQALTRWRPFGDRDSILVKGSRALEELISCRDRRADVPEELSDWVMWLIRVADTEPGLAAEQVRERFNVISAELEWTSVIQPTGPGEGAFAGESDDDAQALDEERAVCAERLAENAEPARPSKTKMRGIIREETRPDKTAADKKEDGLAGAMESGSPADHCGGQSVSGAENAPVAGEAVDSIGRERAWEKAGDERSAPSGSGRATLPDILARRGEVPMAGGVRNKPMEGSGVFLPAPLDALIPEDQTEDTAALEKPDDRVEKRTLDQDHADELPEFLKAPPEKGFRPQWMESPAVALSGTEPPGTELPETEVRESDSTRAAAGHLSTPQNWPEEPMPKSRAEADSLRADAANAKPMSSHPLSGRLPTILLATLLGVSAIVLAGSVLKANLGGNFDVPSAGGMGVDGAKIGNAIATTTADELAGPNNSTLAETLADARANEAEGDDLAAFHDYLEAMRGYPLAAEARESLTRYVESIAERPPDVIGFLERGLVESAEEYQIAPAMRILGERAMRREQWEDAFEWLSKAAVQEDVPGTRLLGILLSEGKGVAKDLAAAAECFEWAALRGDERATHLFGECFVAGKSVEQDAARGIALLEKAAYSGDLRAIDLLGVCYAQGLGAEKNYEKALANFRKAAEGGHPAALANLGVLYIQGLGVKQDAIAAVAYFQEGTEAEDAKCMYYYAKCLEEGLGIEKSRVEAVHWYRRAVAAGSTDAQAWFASQEKWISR